MKPEYRVKMYVYDKTTDELVTKTDEPYTEENDIIAQACILRRQFERSKVGFEENYYEVTQKHEEE